MIAKFKKKNKSWQIFVNILFLSTYKYIYIYKQTNNNQQLPAALFFKYYELYEIN